jgi:hypothetical protein
VAADGYAARDAGEPLAPVAGILAVAFLATLLLQLAQRGRTRVTEALAVTMTGVLLVILAAHLVVVLAGGRDSETVVLIALAAGAAVLGGRLADEVTARDRPTGGTRRGLPGMLAGGWWPVPSARCLEVSAHWTPGPVWCSRSRRESRRRAQTLALSR